MTLKTLQITPLLVIALTSAAICQENSAVQSPEFAPVDDRGPSLVAAASYEVPAYDKSFPLHIMRNPSTIKDLELVKSQRDKIKEIDQAFNQDREMLDREFMLIGDSTTAKTALNAKYAALYKKRATELSDVLLPHQQERIQQIVHQTSLSSLGPAGGLYMGKLGQELDLSIEQRDQLMEIQKELHEQIRQKTAELRAAAREKVMKTLNETQRSKLKSLTGDEFKETEEDWNEVRTDR